MEKWFGYIFVMPVMHRSHHSIDVTYGDANFGSIFSMWDRLLGTYKQKEDSKTNSTVFGVDISKTPKENSMQSFLINPLV
jgi:sterol desaturase/sphingolipid hydroxylase (fatty acid hydroxylase superfamily)